MTSFVAAGIVATSEEFDNLLSFSQDVAIVAASMANASCCSVINAVDFSSMATTVAPYYQAVAVSSTTTLQNPMCLLYTVASEEFSTIIIFVLPPRTVVSNGFPLTHPHSLPLSRLTPILISVSLNTIIPPLPHLICQTSVDFKISSMRSTISVATTRVSIVASFSLSPG